MQTHTHRLTSQVKPGPPLAVESSEGEADEDDTGAQEGCGDDAGVNINHRRQQGAKTEAYTHTQVVKP